MESCTTVVFGRLHVPWEALGLLALKEAFSLLP